MQALTETEARAIYRQQYITEPGFEVITHPALLHLLLDAGVHSVPKRAVRWLQTALGVTADGVIGPKSRAALAAAGQGVLYGKVLGQRLRHLFQAAENLNKLLGRGARELVVAVRCWPPRLRGTQLR